MVLKRVTPRVDESRPKKSNPLKNMLSASQKETKVDQKNPKQKHNTSKRLFAEKVERFASKRIERPQDRDQLLSLLGNSKRVPGPITAADVRARSCLADEIAKEITFDAQRYAADDDGGHWLVTLLRQENLTSDENAMVVMSDLITLSRRALLREFQDFIAVVEVQACATRNHAEGGKTHCWHVHAICRAPAGMLKHAVRLRLEKTFGQLAGEMPAVHLERVRDTPDDLSRIANYILKAPGQPKTMSVRLEDNQKNEHQSEKGDRLIRYARIFEILSLLPLSKLTFAGGNGRFILGRAHLATKRWHAGRAKCPQFRRMADIEDFWGIHRNPFLGKRFPVAKVV